MTDREAGKLGEKFFSYFAGNLMSTPIIKLNDVPDDLIFVEGGDLLAHISRDGKQLLRGGAEVKSWFKDNLFWSGSPKQHVAFEFFAKAALRDDDNNIIFGRNRKPIMVDVNGWLYSFLHAKYLNEHPEVNAVQSKAVATEPVILANLYYRQDKDVSKQHPMCAIVFEDFQALKPKLIELAKDDLGLDLEDPAWFKRDDPRCGYNCGRKTSVRKDLWNVPLEEIAEFATVTLIGDELTDLDPNSARRYDYLKELANGRHFNPIAVQRSMSRIKVLHRQLYPNAVNNTLHPIDIDFLRKHFGVTDPQIPEWVD